MAKINNMFYPNMSLLRYMLSLGILINHFNVLGGHDIPYFISHDRIGGFFALSGFLMYHSYTKKRNITEFIKHRARRIMPTYVFIVLLCAIAGIWITNMPVIDYLTNSSLYKYLLANLTFLNWLHPDLPGVFDSAEFAEKAVNGSLWTMKVEWALDLSVPLFIWFIFKSKQKKEIIAVAIIIMSIVVRFIFWNFYENTHKPIYEILSRQFFGQMGFFYMGMLIYFLKDKIYKYQKQIIAISLIFYILGPYVPYGNIIISPIAVPALFLSISMIGKTFKVLQNHNCISYNIFLIHYPVIQLSIYLGINNLPIWMSLGFVLLVTVALAIFTNRYIDRMFVMKKTRG